MKDVYQVRKTPIEGLWELARLNPRPLTSYMKQSHKSLRRITRAWSIPDKRIKDLLEFLQIKYRNRSYRNPNSIGWHVDGNGSFVNYRKYMIVCVASNEKHLGTEFARGSIKPFASKAWRVYLVGNAIVHRSPQNYKDYERYLFRFDVSIRDSLIFRNCLHSQSNGYTIKYPR